MTDAAACDQFRAVPLSESYGDAIRSYAFAAKTGRLQSSQLDPIFRSECQNEIATAADGALTWSQDNAYGTSFPTETKAVLGAGWYFSSEQAFDMAPRATVSTTRCCRHR